MKAGIVTIGILFLGITILANEPLWTEEQRTEKRDVVIDGEVLSVEKLHETNEREVLYVAKVKVLKTHKSDGELPPTLSVYFEFSKTGENARCPDYAELKKGDKGKFFLRKFSPELKKKLKLEKVGGALFLEMGSDVMKEEPNEDGVITNSIGMKLKLIEAGEFMMGSEKGEKNEKPIHKVKITKPFYMGVCEVTQAQYEKIMGKNPSVFKGPDRPVDSVMWDDAVLFCKKLSEEEGVEYRLPTEAEWEYTCRAGTTTMYYWGDEMDRNYAWYWENSEERTHDVGKKKPNAWDLYDMSGNAYEWCSDWYDADYYENSPGKDPQGPKGDGFRVLRGGSWFDHPRYCRSASRFEDEQDREADDSYGFRVVREVE